MEYEVENNLISTFYIGNTMWGIDIMNTQEVILIQDITKVYNAPNYIEGIINLRGRIVTVLSLCKKLNIEPEGDVIDQRIIIVNVGDEYLGLLVDKISEVVEVDKKAIMSSPSTVSGVNGRYINGIYHFNNITIASLNLDSVLNTEEDE